MVYGRADNVFVDEPWGVPYDGVVRNAYLRQWWRGMPVETRGGDVEGYVYVDGADVPGH